MLDQSQAEQERDGWDALGESLGEVGEEGVLVLGVLVGVLTESLVGHERHVGAELLTVPVSRVFLKRREERDTPS